MERWNMCQRVVFVTLIQNFKQTWFSSDLGAQLVAGFSNSCNYPMSMFAQIWSTFCPLPWWTALAKKASSTDEMQWQALQICCAPVHFCVHTISVQLCTFVCWCAHLCARKKVVSSGRVIREWAGSEHATCFKLREPSQKENLSRRPLLFNERCGNMLWHLFAWNLNCGLLNFFRSDVCVDIWGPGKSSQKSYSCLG